MKSTNCETVRDRLVELRRGTLSALEAAEVEAHLSRCEECAAEGDVLRALETARRSAPDGFAEGVLAAWRGDADRSALAAPGARPLSLVAEDRETVQPAARRARPAAQALPLAAAAAGVLLVGALLARTGFRAQPDATEVALSAAEAGVEILPWPGDDGVLAGAPALDALSNDEIEALLAELDS